ncbi:MAG: AarF/UbiB family protein, partial [Burkholderiales bacterium]
MRLLRLLKILRVSLRFGLDEFLLGHERVRALRGAVSTLLFWRDLSAPRAVRLRHALETLGPIFVKFGQILSTRRDLIPPDIAEELARLQDQVPPFPGADVERILAAAYDKPLGEVFSHFDRTPIASASVAQVHIGKLADGKEVAVKVLRPGIAGVIAKDVALLDAGAVLLEWLWLDGKRLKPREVVAEFARHLEDELDLMREAANASQLRRNFRNSPLLAVPEIHWQHCSTEVMV